MEGEDKRGNKTIKTTKEGTQNMPAPYVLQRVSQPISKEGNSHELREEGRGRDGGKEGSVDEQEVGMKGILESGNGKLTNTFAKCSGHTDPPQTGR
ncbi:hypothetical protein E2C01_065488 [Portunus trituberculatus]|uniref:Uncharacterized protein n=1 Tax=Portunus trituberculatus TaxID=210409 RepID=A0A5B7HMQ2_PORTR|nr:hypothetical protein [Portunus trituberculatus]